MALISFGQAFDKVMGIKPGDLCSKRDLPLDLIKELKKYGLQNGISIIWMNGTSQRIFC